MSIYITKDGEKRKVNISATDVQLLDIDGNFESKNLEDALKELSSAGGGGNIPHDHDDRYYTENEIDEMLSKKADKDKSPVMSSGTFTPNVIDAKTGEHLVLGDDDYHPITIGNYTTIGNMCFFSIEILYKIIQSKDEDREIAIELPFNASNNACVATACNRNTSMDIWLNADRISRIHGNKLYIEEGYKCGTIFMNNRIMMSASGFFFIQQESRKANTSTTDIQLVDTDDKFEKKNLEGALKEIGNITNNTHDHDDRYYTESEIDTMLSKKVDKDKSPAMSSGTFTPIFVDGVTGKPVRINKEGSMVGNYTIIGNTCFFSIEVDGVEINSEDRWSDISAAIKLELPFKAINDVCIVPMLLPCSADEPIAYGGIRGDTIDILGSEGNNMPYHIISMHEIEMTTSGFFIIQQ